MQLLLLTWTVVSKGFYAAQPWEVLFPRVTLQCQNSLRKAHSCSVLSLYLFSLSVIMGRNATDLFTCSVHVWSADHPSFSHLFNRSTRDLPYLSFAHASQNRTQRLISGVICVFLNRHACKAASSRALSETVSAAGGWSIIKQKTARLASHFPPARTPWVKPRP